MALRKLIAKKRLDELNKKLTEARSEEAGFLMRETELEKREAEAIKAVEELTEESTEEERSAVETEADAIDAEREAIATEKAAKEAEKAELERQVAELEAELAEDNAPPVDETPADEPEVDAVRNAPREERKMNKFETRSQMLERLDRVEVRDFYTKVVEAAREQRAITGGDLTIPEVIVDVILTKMGDYAKVKPLVNTVRLKGTARVLLDGAIPEGIWVECCDPVQELAATITAIDLDCYKVGGFVEVCNALIHDSIINLADYVETKIAQAIAKAVDKAILVGTGSVGKQPAGIIPAVDAVAAQEAAAGDLKAMMAAIAKVDTGEGDIGPLTAVMNRATYYTWIQPDMLLATATGQLAMQSADGATLPDGTKVVFSQYMPANQVLIGDFYAGYILAERQELTLAVSTEHKFIQDNTVFKGIARYDGKPVDTKYFVLVTLATTP